MNNCTLVNAEIQNKAVQIENLYGIQSRTNRRFGRVSPSALNEFIKTHEPLFPKRTKIESRGSQRLAKYIRKIRPSLDLRKIRKGRKVFIVPRVIPEKKRQLYGVKDILSFYLLDSSRWRDKGISSSVESNLTSTQQGIPQNRIESALSSSVSTRQPKIITEDFNRPSTKPSVNKAIIPSQKVFLPMRKVEGKRSIFSYKKQGRYKSFETRALTRLRDTNSVETLFAHNLQITPCRTLYPQRTYMDRPPTRIGSTNGMFELYKENKSYILQHPFYIQAFESHMPFLYKDNKTNCLSLREHDSNNLHNFSSNRGVRKSIYENRRYQKQYSLLRVHKDTCSYRLSSSLRRYIENALSPRSTMDKASSDLQLKNQVFVQNKKRNYRNIFANRGNIRMSWWL